MIKCTLICVQPLTLGCCNLLTGRFLSLNRTCCILETCKAQYRSEGNVFMESEQVARFRALSSKTRVDESWLKDPQNLVCWLENHEENKHQLAEKLWLIHKWQGERCNMNESIVKKSDVEELLRAFDEEIDENNENEDFFRM